MKMQDVYRESVAALVLDAGLLQHSGPLDPLEVLVRVQTSDWGPPFVNIPGSSASAQEYISNFKTLARRRLLNS